MPEFFFYLIFSFSISVITTPLMILVSKKFNLVDDPDRRPHPAHTHKGPIPRGGGLPIFLGIFIPLLLSLKINSQITGIFLGSLILILVGLWDDYKDRSPYIRLILNSLVAVVAITSGVVILYTSNPFGGIIHFNTAIFTMDFFGSEIQIQLSHIISFFWILWTTNIIGWSGGVDGQLPGFVAISSIIIGILSLRYFLDPNQTYVTFLSFMTAGSFLGFLLWNFYPQKIMPGYGGKTLAGFMLAVLSILSYSKLGTALLVLIIPMSDAIFILSRRLISGKSPLKASKGHLHHQLLAMGWGKRKISIFYWMISHTAGLCALVLNPRLKIFAFVFIGILVMIFITWINFLQRFPKNT